jgi:nucleoid-associated protein YgaU
MRGARIRTGILGLGLVLLLGLGACSHGPVPPPKDPTAGEFYTNDEVLRLPAAERNRYCGYLESTLHELRAEAAVLKTRLDSLGVQADTLRNQSIRVNAETRDLNVAVRDLRLKQKAATSYLVKEGDNLRKVAEMVWSDVTRWKEIYEANKAAIGSEETPLKPGTRLIIPPMGSAPVQSPGRLPGQAPTPSPVGTPPSGGGK